LRAAQPLLSEWLTHAPPGGAVQGSLLECPQVPKQEARTKGAHAVVS